MADVKDEGPKPIYVSYSTLITFLDWLRETKVTPTRIDRSLWSSKFSGAVGSQLMGGLRFLKLLDAELRPTPALEGLVRAAPDQRKELLLPILRDAYGATLVDELPGMTPGMLKERLSKLGTTDATYDKAQSFFINAAKDIGLDVPISIAKKARSRGASPKRRTSTRANGSSKALTDPPSTKHPPEKDLPKDETGDRSGDSRTIVLANGVGAVTLTVRVNWLTLGSEQRMRLFQLIDTFNELEQKLPGGDASRPEATSEGGRW